MNGNRRFIWRLWHWIPDRSRPVNLYLPHTQCLPPQVFSLSLSLKINLSLFLSLTHISSHTHSHSHTHTLSLTHRNTHLHTHTQTHAHALIILIEMKYEVKCLRPCEKMSFQFFSNKQSLSSLFFYVRLSVCVVVNLIYVQGRCFEFCFSFSFSSFLSKITFSPSFTFLSMQGTRQSNPSDAILNVLCLFHSLDNTKATRILCLATIGLQGV